MVTQVTPVREGMCDAQGMAECCSASLAKAAVVLGSRRGNAFALLGRSRYSRNLSSRQCVKVERGVSGKVQKRSKVYGEWAGDSSY